MKKELQKKLEDVIGLVENALANPDIELAYCIPDVAMTVDNADVSGDPYIELTYRVNSTHTQKQKIPIKKNYLKKTPEDLANLITFYIEQFTEQIDSVEFGPQ